MKARTIIKSTLKKLVVIAEGQEPSDGQYDDGLEILNDIAGSWSANASLIYEEAREFLVIPANTQSFSVGLTGDIVTSRPVQIVHHTLMQGGAAPSALIGWTGDSFCGGEFPAGLAVGSGNGLEFQLEQSDVVEHGKYSHKSTVSRPNRLYYQKAYPNGVFHFNSTTDQVYTIVLNSYKAISKFPDLDTEVHLPDFYEKALKDTLTIEFAPQMCSANRITQMMVESARESKNAIVGRSLNINIATTELSRGGSYSHSRNDSNGY